MLSGHAAFAAKNSGTFSIGAEALGLFLDAYSAVWYEDGVSDGRFTPVWLGAMGVDHPVLEAARTVNELKDHFRRSVISAKEGLRNQNGFSVAGTDKSFRKLMNEIGLAKLSLRMAYRHIPIVDRPPTSIRFSYCSAGKSISAITPQQAYKELMETGFTGAHIDYQASILGSIPPDTHLAKVQKLAGYYKANLKFEEEPLKLTLPCFLPILYLKGGLDPDRQPEIPRPTLTSKRLRKDRKLCSIPLIPTLRIHAYH